MSTYHYLECSCHNPPLTSDEEVEQHRGTETLEKVRELVRRRDVILPLVRAELVDYPDDRYLRNALTFLNDHEHCVIGLVTEYGERESIR
ncbi:hypothetical protein BJD61_gp75 [Gordonia phage Obliviate]|uniref:hypothetical protein n=1 Tax=Gordonia phage Obliviate TaxID=1821559 RepID=UPI00078BE2F5|nr:hypothetical protein BJD61_gp75 [Gordonia phage Obliviate]AMS03154.1 hypothetical protein SEA_OBLIVIATE_75 [Gordonia phage Obliviate]QDB74579.1 hypothetical protein SEA_MELBA_75 [Gordonia phage Melba]